MKLYYTLEAVSGAPFALAEGGDEIVVSGVGVEESEGEFSSPSRVSTFLRGAF